MIHLRIIVPDERAERTMELLENTPDVCNLIRLPGAAAKPKGDVILCDAERETASVLISDLRELVVEAGGTIAIEDVTTEISPAARPKRRPKLGSYGVLWEQVEARTSEDTELSPVFLAFMVLAGLIASIGILTDQPILIVGAMVVGPEFGPLAGLSVAIVERRAGMARRSLVALAVGFPVAIGAALLFGLLISGASLTPADYADGTRPLTQFISSPDEFSFMVAYLAGTAGVLSLTAAKSGALIGVLVSVTTIPAAANIGVAAAYGHWGQCSGAAEQLAINLAGIVLAGVVTLTVQRRIFLRRRARHMGSAAREAAGLPGRSTK